MREEGLPRSCKAYTFLMASAGLADSELSRWVTASGGGKQAALQEKQGGWGQGGRPCNSGPAPLSLQGPRQAVPSDGGTQWPTISGWP